MTYNPNKQRMRDERNEASRNEAEQHATLWSEHEVTTLIELWPGNPDDLVTLAALLGRTVEACRQKYYMTQQKVVAVPDEVKKSVQRLDKWARGFTSLDDMGY